MDILTLLSEHGLGARVVSQGSELCMACPLCNDHKTRMFLNRRTFLWKCHNCDEGGGLYRFLEVVLDLDPIEVYRTVRELDYHFVPIKTVERDQPAVEMPDSVLLRDVNSPIEQPFWHYLTGPTRRLTPTEVVDYQMRACVIGRFAMRVIIPIHQAGKLVSFVARSIYDSCPCGEGGCKHKWVKVLYPQGPHKSGILFNIDRVRGQEEAVLVEGAFDAIRLSDRAVATLGATVSPEQRQMLKAYGFERVVLLYDSDEAGKKGTRRAARELAAAGFDVRISSLPEGVDPASAPSRILDNCLANATSEAVLCSTTELKRRSKT